jgi:hypothetical protein
MGSACGRPGIATAALTKAAKAIGKDRNATALSREGSQTGEADFRSFGCL